jgi:hypothetical protein
MKPTSAPGTAATAKLSRLKADQRALLRSAPARRPNPSLSNPTPR